MVDVVVVVSLEMEADTAMWSCDAFLVLVAGECALGLRLRKDVSFRRLLRAKGHIMNDEKFDFGECTQITPLHTMYGLALQHLVCIVKARGEEENSSQSDGSSRSSI